ncbi:MAG: ATP-binding cassette domain-containing protein [Eubacteriales bacterium]|nr:ATP-binding cassette domain-containing protein [Eubacteriales bacterium]MDD4421809.1 ATP-binding cassette domain-containing protein [Eubacteriales bacterium]HBR30513.1 ABC transporter ATP-binding protein [Clostridiales bacterium]
MLQVKKLTITHTKNLKILIEDLNFTLNEGDRAVIIGEEGNGKSTLLKLIYNKELVRSYIDYTGEIVKNNTKLGYLAQELTSEQKDMSVSAYFSQIQGCFETTPADLSLIARQIGLSLEFFYSGQCIRTLSGGEKIKLQMAGILIEHPDVLLLDEPSNDIDIETLEWLERFIISCKKPVLYVSHDETLIEKTANMIIHIELVRRKTLPRNTVARMLYGHYIERRLSKLAHQKQVAVKEKSDFEKQQEKLQKIMQKVEHHQNAISRKDPHGGRMLKKKMKNVKSLEKRFEKEFENRTQIPDTEEAIMIMFDDDIGVPNGKTILDFKKDRLYLGERLLSENIELNIVGGRKICIVGKNGVGKTTLLKKIAEELLERRDIKASYMPQNYEEILDYDKTPVEFLSVTGEKYEVTKIKNYLGSVKYTTDEMERTVSEMSGGQKAKLLFMKMILEKSNVLILDEPTRNFSPISNPVIREVLKEYKGAIICVSHDRKFISEVCDTVYRMTEKGLEMIDFP